MKTSVFLVSLKKRRRRKDLLYEKNVIICILKYKRYLHLCRKKFSFAKKSTLKNGRFNL